MVKIMKDMEIAQHIGQCDSDLPSETDASIKYLLESDTSMPEQTPRLLCGIVLSCDSDEWECYIPSGGEGSDWQKVADGNDI